MRVPEPAHFDAARECAALPGETLEQLQQWVYVWGCLKLEDIHGFPTWEAAVNRVLHRHWIELLQIFAFYSGGGEEEMMK